ncbi:MAG: Re/Si-specific NAD(P)(+) transhydrogenase subunit alpha [Phycisphaerales bacterium]|nr:Re/Si-specific NAD(P)(+) transhydrogenase subunit alpha [Phycisphaerales bacterium]
MKVGIPLEIHESEQRVAAVPSTVQQLIKLGFEVQVEAGAGFGARISNGSYSQVGATVVEDTKELWSTSDLILKVRAPEQNEAGLLADGASLISFIQPATNAALLEQLAARHATVFGVDCIPRISRAQKMDALSAMANIAGYRAVIEASYAYPHFLGGQMTAAGRIDPAKVLVIGGGVAGLAAVTAAKGLGAIVRAFDTRMAVKEQVESLGGEFLVLDFDEAGEGSGGYAKVMSKEFIEAEMALFAQQAIEVDIIITTAVIPGRDAPKLITGGMIETMRQGSVIVDLAAEFGGNCVLTEPGRMIEHHGVNIIGFTDLPSRMATLSSRLYSNSVLKFIEEIGDAGNFNIDHGNEVVRGALVLENGETRWPPPKVVKPEGDPYSVDVGERPAKVKPAETSDAAVESNTNSISVVQTSGIILGILVLIAIGLWAPADFVSHFTVFVLACFIGWQVVWNVSPALHTPLMSVTNAISGIIILGGMLHLSADSTTAAIVLGVFAVFFATINICGGFLVTRRMLAMFRR